MIGKTGNNDSSTELHLESGSGDDSDLSIVYKAAGILRKAVGDVTNLKVDCYPNAEDVGLSSSAQFVPEILQLFTTWLIDKNAFDNCTESKSLKTHRSLSISESIIFSSRKVITPLHLGLAAYLHHEFASRDLLDVMNRFGFTVCYDEVRRFLTSCAKMELDYTNNSQQLPTNLISRSDEGMLIQEGNDNIDIQRETIDGFGQTHGMGRVVIQYQDPTQRATSKRKRGPNVDKNKALGVGMTADCAANYRKPSVRPEAPRRGDAEQMIQKCVRDDTTVKTDNLSWVFLRNCTRSIYPDFNLPSNQQVVPFWAGFNALAVEANSTYVVHAYKPVINSQPTDPETMYRTMKGCRETAVAADQEVSVQIVDQQLYAIAQEIKWDRPVEFAHHVIRIGGMHTLFSYIAAIGSIFGDAGLRELLADSCVYAGGSVDRMLKGKEFRKELKGKKCKTTQTWFA